MISLLNPLDIAYVIGGFLLAFTLVTSVYLLAMHFLGRWNKVATECIKLGFGKPLIQRASKAGTRWQLGWVPLGGYVSFTQHPGSIQAGQRYFENLSVWRRAVIMAAGPASSFVLAFALLTAVSTSNRLTEIEPVIGAVRNGTPADLAGIKVGDRVVEIDGTAITYFSNITVRLNAAAPGAAVSFLVARDGVERNIRITPMWTDSRDALGGTARVATIGILAPTNPKRIDPAPFNFMVAVYRGWDEMVAMLSSIARTGRESFSGHVGLERLGGVVTLAMLCGLTAKLGLIPYLSVVALVSIINGVINIIPVPPMLGGQLALLAIEGVRGKPLSQPVTDRILRIGLVLVLAFFALLAAADFKRVMALTLGR